MGMYNDNVGAGRTGWTFTYSGKELLPYAKKLYNEFNAKEHEARKLMSTLMLDQTISQSGREVQETRQSITSFGTLKEQCLVYKHEFARNPDKVYDLGLGDVTFFGLAEDK